MSGTREDHEKTANSADYLAVHIVEILAHAAGGRHPARAWLCKNDRCLRHSFERPGASASDWSGGQIIPIDCLIYAKPNQKARIFEPRRNEVAIYLLSFGLTEPQADKIVRKNL